MEARGGTPVRAAHSAGGNGSRMRGCASGVKGERALSKPFEKNTLF